MQKFMDQDHRNLRPFAERRRSWGVDHCRRGRLCLRGIVTYLWENSRPCNARPRHFHVEASTADRGPACLSCQLHSICIESLQKWRDQRHLPPDSRCWGSAFKSWATGKHLIERMIRLTLRSQPRRGRVPAALKASAPAPAPTGPSPS